jgi:signal transduction histidine kinase
VRSSWTRVRASAAQVRALFDPNAVADHLSVVLDASERARELVRLILTISRRSTPHERVVDLGAVVRALVPMWRSLIPRTVKLTVRGGDGTYPVRARVFAPFFTTRPTGEGTGLGLSVLHGIVVSHGGRVRVERTEGEGTTFEVHFPLLGSEASAARVVECALTRLGGRVRTFSDLREALAFRTPNAPVVR